MRAAPDPYATLGVSASATDAEVRSAYRRLVQLHHPDHNGGSAESARRFEEVQDAYAEVRRLRVGGRSGARPRRASGGAATSHGSRPSTNLPPDDSELGSRLAEMEKELRDARDEALRQARRAAARARGPASERASDEELGYISSDDSFGKILSDAAADISKRVDHATDEARASPVTKRLADLIDELGSKLTGEPPEHK